jgi:hypothetical protein
MEASHLSSIAPSQQRTYARTHAQKGEGDAKMPVAFHDDLRRTTWKHDAYVGGEAFDVESIASKHSHFQYDIHS